MTPRESTETDREYMLRLQASNDALSGRLEQISMLAYEWANHCDIETCVIREHGKKLAQLVLGDE